MHFFSTKRADTTVCPYFLIIKFHLLNYHLCNVVA